MELQAVESYEFDSFRVDVVSRRLFRDEQTVKLPAKDFDILLLLVSHFGQVVTKEELMGHVWPDQFVEDNNLTVRISALRKLLGESHTKARYIQTGQGPGDRFVAKVRTVDTAKGGQGKWTTHDAQRTINSLAVIPFGLITANPHQG